MIIVTVVWMLKDDKWSQKIVRILSNILLNNFCKILTQKNKEYISEKGCKSVKKLKNRKLINMVGP